MSPQARSIAFKTTKKPLEFPNKLHSHVGKHTYDQAMISKLNMYSSNHKDATFTSMVVLHLFVKIMCDRVVFGILYTNRRCFFFPSDIQFTDLPNEPVFFWVKIHSTFWRIEIAYGNVRICISVQYNNF